MSDLSDTAIESIRLTDRQQQILDLVREAIEQTGAPPTRAEIATALGFRSVNAAEEHLKALARKGAIELVGGTSRGIRLTTATLRAVNAARMAAVRGDGAAPAAAPRSRGSRNAAGGSRFATLPTPAALASALLQVPLVGRVAAGSPILAAEHVEQTYALEPGLFTRRPDYLLRVRGMSMRDAGILDGDLLAVESAREARNGQIVVARLGDEVTVKRLRRDGRRISLLPENPDFQPIVVEGDEAFAIEGIAVGLVRTTPLS